MGDEREADVSRRDLGALLGALGGAVGLAALSSCTTEAGATSSSETLGTTSEALKGGVLSFVRIV